MRCVLWLKKRTRSPLNPHYQFTAALFAAPRSELFPSCFWRNLTTPTHRTVTARSSTLVKLEALRSCVHACDLGKAFLSWASALSRPPKTAVESQQQKRHTSSDVRQSRRTTLRLLEALRLVVLHEPLGHAHHALQRWHELAKVGRSPRAALHERNDRAWPPKGRVTPATRQRRSPPLGAEEREALVSVTSDDLHTLMESVADLQEQLVCGHPYPARLRLPVGLDNPCSPVPGVAETTRARVGSCQEQAGPLRGAASPLR